MIFGELLFCTFYLVVGSLVVLGNLRAKEPPMKFKTMFYLLLLWPWALIDFVLDFVLPRKQ